jgi:transmembrane sensor
VSSEPSREALLRELRSESEAPWDELREQRVLAQLREARSPHQPSRRRRAVRVGWGIASAVAAAALIAVAIMTRESAGGGDRGGASAIATATGGETPRLALGDGSWVALGSAAQVQIEEEAPDRVRVRQGAGSATYHVTRRPERGFEVRTDHAIVRVRGTVFEVAVEDGATTVRVEAGRVEVADHARLTVLGAGEMLRVAAAAVIAPASEDGAGAQRAASEDGAAAGAQSAAREDGSGVQSAASEDGSGAQSAASGLRRERRTAAARDPAQTAEGAPPASPAEPASAPAEALVRARSYEQLLASADAARRAGALDDAAALLERAILGARDDGGRAVALFTLGRVEIARGRARAAATTFERCAEVAPLGALAEDASAAAANAWNEAGQTERARERASAYLERWPAGHHAAAMRRLVP